MPYRTSHLYNEDAAAWFAEVAEELHAQSDPILTAEAICTRAMEGVPAATWCGITLRRRRGVLETVAVTDEIVRKVDELQVELDEGPSLEFTSNAGFGLIADTASDPRFPKWGPAVAALGARSVISVQLVNWYAAEASTLGTINIYADEPRSLTTDDLDHTVIFGTHASAALASAQHVDTLETAVFSRHLIGVAQGILMQRYGLSMERSFEALRRISSEHHIKLRLVAEAVIENGELPTPEEARAQSPKPA